MASTEGLKRCPYCKEEKLLTEFHKARERKQGVRTYCKPCQAIKFKINYEKNRENWIKRSSKAVRKLNLKKRYRLTEEDYIGKLREQSSCCGICNKHIDKLTKKLAVDHDHKTGRVRALLCHKCNMGLGCYNDDVDLLQTAIEYLKSWSN